jgi:plastocyanin
MNFESLGSRNARKFSAIVTTIIAAGIVACGGGGGSSKSNIPTDPTTGGTNNGGTGSTTTPSNTLTVTVKNNEYTPGATTVAKGKTVQWTWDSCTSDPYGYGTGSECTSHSVTFDDGVTSQVQDKGGFQRTFNAAGTYKYHCSVHGAAMSGEITVQ